VKVKATDVLLAGRGIVVYCLKLHQYSSNERVVMVKIEDRNERKPQVSSPRARHAHMLFRAHAGARAHRNSRSSRNNNAQTS
jgi:hypothetical protein